jgi:hypothetical protein
MKPILAIAVLLVGCSYTFDSEAPTLPLIGTQPDTPSLPRLNTAPVSGEIFALGDDGRIWIILEQTDKTWRLLPMSGDDQTPQILTSEEVDDLYVTWHHLFITKRDKPIGGVSPTDMGGLPPIHLTIRGITEQPGHTFELPDGPSVLIPVGGEDQVFAFINMVATEPGYLLQRRDESFRRIVPWPKGVDPTSPFKDGAYFSDIGDGDYFFDRDIDGRVVAHSTRDNLDIDLGIRPRFMAWVDTNTLVSCGSDGVRVFTTDGFTPERILDNDPCKTQLLQLGDDTIYYDVGTTVRKTALDGSLGPEMVFDFGQARVLLLNTDGDDVIYSTDPVDRYVHGVGDGWLLGWKFMERGSVVTLSRERTKLWWLEHSAQGSGVGNLTTVNLPGPGQPGGTPVTLTRNTRRYSVLRDGRVICDENRANQGVWNRVVVVDEANGHKQWVASSANYFSPIPRSSDYIVDVISGATGHDVVRVSIPPVVVK